MPLAIEQVGAGKEAIGRNGRAERRIAQARCDLPAADLADLGDDFILKGIDAVEIGRRQRFGAAVHERSAIMGRNQACGEFGKRSGHEMSRKIRPSLFRSKQYWHLHRFGGWNPLGRCP
ncbi:hypothetical protein D3C87_1686800 [compost metagenome]